MRLDRSVVVDDYRPGLREFPLEAGVEHEEILRFAFEHPTGLVINFEVESDKRAWRDVRLRITDPVNVFPADQLACILGQVQIVVLGRGAGANRVAHPYVVNRDVAFDLCEESYVLREFGLCARRDDSHVLVGRGKTGAAKQSGSSHCGNQQPDERHSSGAVFC